MLEWYAFLSRLNAALVGPIQSLSDALNIPLLTALLLGLLGSTSPCQITTNASALAYVSRGLERRGAAFGQAVAFALGKVAIYSAVGLLVIGLGWKLGRSPVQVITIARRALGPLMLLYGLYSLGWVRLPLPQWVLQARPLQGTSERPGTVGAFLLGVAFSFASCPTLYWLFFGVLIPLALSSGSAVLYPAAFAIGTALPLLGMTLTLQAGAEAAGPTLGKLRRIGRHATRIAAVVFILAGLHDTVVYWFI